MIYAFQLYLILCTLALAVKDADSYQLKEKKDNTFSATRVKRWHRDGLLLAALYVLPLFEIEPALWWKTLIAAVLIRLVFFDYPFNKWAGLDKDYLGGTAWADKQFVHIFGMYGAVRKSVTFLIILVACNLLNHFLCLTK